MAASSVVNEEEKVYADQIALFKSSDCWDSASQIFYQNRGVNTGMTAIQDDSYGDTWVISGRIFEAFTPQYNVNATFNMSSFRFQDSDCKTGNEEATGHSSTTSYNSGESFKVINSVLISTLIGFALFI